MELCVENNKSFSFFKVHLIAKWAYCVTVKGPPCLWILRQNAQEVLQSSSSSILEYTA